MLALAGPGTAQQTCTFRVVNRGPLDIVQLYIMQSGNSNWGPDRLAGRPLHANEAQPFYMPVEPPNYDVRSIYSDRYEHVSRDVNVCLNDLVVSHG